jgi:hypothetical protein
MEKDKYDYDNFGKKGKRVGQAVTDIMSMENKPVVTAEDIADARQSQYIKDLEAAAELGIKEFKSPFYVVFLFNKEKILPTAPRGRFVRRQTEPLPENMVTMFPYFAKDVWKVDYEKGTIDYLWTLPSLENIRQMLKHKDQYDPALEEWLKHPTAEKTPYSEIATG